MVGNPCITWQVLRGLYRCSIAWRRLNFKSELTVLKSLRSFMDLWCLKKCIVLLWTWAVAWWREEDLLRWKLGWPQLVAVFFIYFTLVIFLRLTGAPRAEVACSLIFLLFLFFMSFFFYFFGSLVNQQLTRLRGFRVSYWRDFLQISNKKDHEKSLLYTVEKGNKLKRKCRG